MKNNNMLAGELNSSNKVRVRFAPSPTGYLHLGGARTALYNWLFARGQQGIFLLRIEDTDQERSEDRFLQQIVEDLKWLGLSWDEGPFFQHERKEIYTKYAKALIQDQKAYYCFCSPSEVERQREECARQNITFRYDGRCRQISLKEAMRRVESGASASIRFSTPQHGRTEFNDLIRKRVSFENTEFDDFIIVRSNGEPTYNYTVVVDDADMNITHVIRGEDHISNTPKQILLYRAMGFPLPQFAHIPMIMGPDNTRLSKRHGATAVGQYREMGYLPEALVNYLALLGWSYDDKQTIFSVTELIEKFNLKKVSKKAAIFDPQKLDWMNGKYIRELDDREFISLSLPYIYKAGLIDERIWQSRSLIITQILLSVRGNVKKFSDLPALTEFFFKDAIVLSEEAKKMIFSQENNFHFLQEIYQQLRELDSMEKDKVDKIIQEIVKQRGIKLGDLIQPLRASVTGRLASPEIFLTLALLGKDKVLKRLSQVLEDFACNHSVTPVIESKTKPFEI